MNKTRQTVLYIFFDLLSAVCSWTAFFLLRKGFIDPTFGNIKPEITLDINYYYGLSAIPVMWLLLYYLNGYYKNIYKKSRLNELTQTFLITLLGSIIIFFSILLDDIVETHQTYYKSLVFLFTTHFVLTYIPRVIITSITNAKIHNRKIGFNTLIIGSNEKALDLYKRLQNKRKSTGYKFVGFVNVIEQDSYILLDYLPHLGYIDSVAEIIKKNHIEEVIIAIESKEHQYLEKILYSLEGVNIIIKAIPDNYDIISGRVTLSSIYDEPLISISHDLMPSWQENTKRVMDVCVSAFVLTFGMPFYLLVALCVKLSSSGPVFYKQKRIGLHGKPFYIYKFRSMYVNAESNGPELTQENDTRITKVGEFIRRFRIDEIPQFFNVLKGDMSLVGPRPEREYFIQKLIQHAPHFVHLQRVKPGITSWGQVKYGYAKNIDEMLERLQYDIIYIENMSLYVDVKILIYTVKIVLLGKGL
ncbi:MAG: sugar transferase [Bacteroidota bacterium]